MNLDQLNATLNHPAEPELAQEVHTADGSVSRGANAGDAIINLQLQAHLRLRARRGRDPMVAHLLGFFEGEAAVERGNDVVSLNGVEMSHADAMRELEDIT